MVCFGTYRLSPTIAENMIEYAIQHGNIKRFDTAQLYKNQEHVLRKIRVDLHKTSEEIFITTKIQRKLIEQCIVDNRGIINSIYDIIALKPNTILLHAPVENYQIAWQQLTCALEHTNIQAGVSNFDVKHLTSLNSHPYINQIEISPFNQNRNVTSYCVKHNIKIESHSTLTKGEKFNNEIIRQIAARHNTSVAKIFIAFNISFGYMPIFSTSKIHHFEDDCMGDYPILDQSDIDLLTTLECQYRTHPQYKYDV